MQDLDTVELAAIVVCSIASVGLLYSFCCGSSPAAKTERKADLITLNEEERKIDNRVKPEAKPATK